MQGRVDPRPLRVPTLGLLASANNIINGGDEAQSQRVNAPSDTAYDPSTVIGDSPPSDWERPVRGAPVRWINGFSYRPETCNDGDIIVPTAGAPGTPPGDEDLIEIHPYIVEGSYKTSTPGTPQDNDYAEAREYARRTLLACEEKQISRELWLGKDSNGAATGNPFLADANVDLVEGDRLLGYLTALAVLERAIKDGTCTQQGMIHARSDTISLWDTGGALRRVGNLILTIEDTIVVPGGGYDGSGPTGAAHEDPQHYGDQFSTDSAWAYATTVVDVRRSAFLQPQHIVERLDTAVNTLTTYERRIAASTWGCLQVGVHVDHINSISTTGS